MTYYAGSHTRGGRTEPERKRRTQKSALPLSELIARKRLDIIRAEMELQFAMETANPLYIRGAEDYLKAMQSGLATLEKMQDEESQS